MPPVPVSEEDEFLSMLKQQANILHQLQQQRGLAPVRAAAQNPWNDLAHPLLVLSAFGVQLRFCGRPNNLHQCAQQRAADHGAAQS